MHQCWVDGKNNFRISRRNNIIPYRRSEFPSASSYHCPSLLNKHNSFKGTASETRKLWNLINTVPKHSKEPAGSTVPREAGGFTLTAPALSIMHMPQPSVARVRGLCWRWPLFRHRSSWQQGAVFVIYPPRPPTRSGPGAGYHLPLTVHNDCCVRVLTWTQKPSSLRACLFSCIIHSSTFSTQQ